MPAMLMEHDIDPAKDILDRIGSLEDFPIMGNRVLVAVYKRPERTMSKIILPDQTRAEDEHQGKAALVLKKGPAAFKTDEHYDFQGDDVNPGDWISLWVTDGRKVTINKVLCRVVRDQDIVMKIPAPDAVF